MNPARLVKSFTEDNARERFLTREEFGKLLGMVRRDHPAQAPSLIVAAYSALRWSEQYGITWKHVDLKRRLITRVHTKDPGSVRPRYRDVPLNSVSIAALQEQMKLDAPRTGPNNIVFPKDGEYADWDWWLKPALREAGLQDVVWHTLRHTCLSWAAMSGATMKEIQELGGHLTISQAARYMHLSPSHKSTAIRTDGTVDAGEGGMSGQQVAAGGETAGRRSQIWGPTATKTATRDMKAPALRVSSWSKLLDFIGVIWRALRDSNSRPTDS